MHTALRKRIYSIQSTLKRTKLPQSLIMPQLVAHVILLVSKEVLNSTAKKATLKSICKSHSHSIQGTKAWPMWLMGILLIMVEDKLLANLEVVRSNKF